VLPGNRAGLASTREAARSRMSWMSPPGDDWIGCGLAVFDEPGSAIGAPPLVSGHVDGVKYTAQPCRRLAW
jgi:hypothetical protein